jgi:hypothetical protein
VRCSDRQAYLDKEDGAEELEEADGPGHLGHGSLGDSSVVERSHLGGAECLDSARELVNVLCDGSCRGEHGDAAVLELGLAEEAAKRAAKGFRTW